MKMQTKNLINELTNSQVQNLTNQVKETLATGSGINQHKIFSSADLWDIQRRRRSTLIR